MLSDHARGWLVQRYRSLLRRCLALGLEALVAVLASVGLVHAASIVADGLTQTQVMVKGAVTDITTQTIRGANAYNSFSRFNVETAERVNLYLPGQTSNLLNLVHDETSYINGLVNAYKGGRIGGNVFFFNPHGIVVGAGGVLNVGSLTLATPTPGFMKELVDPNGNIGDAATAAALSGQIPLSQSGLVLVKGRINAADAVTLAGGSVDVAPGAAVLAWGQAGIAFEDMVNVDGMQTGAAVRVDGGVIRIVAAEDITVAGQVSADGVGSYAKGGTVTIMAGGDATLASTGRVSADAGTTGDGGFVEFSAKHEVNLYGYGLSAHAAQGRAGHILIDPENLTWTGSGEDRYTHGDNITISADDKVVLDNVVVSTRNIGGAADTRANHQTLASQGDSGDIEVTAKVIEIKNGSQLLANADNGFSAGDISIAATDNQSTPAFAALDSSIATILIDRATLKGGNVSVTATANDKWVWTGNEFGDAVLGFLDDLRIGLNISYSYAWAHVDVLNGSSIDAAGTLDVEAVAKADATMRVLSTLVGVGYGESDANAKVNIGIATLGAGGAMTLRAQADSTLTVEVDTVNTGKFNNAASNASQYADFAFAIGKGKQVAEAVVGPNATIVRADSLSVEATGEKSQSVASSGGAYKDGTASAGVSVSISETTLTASLGGTVNADSVTVQAALADDASTEVSASAGTAGSPDLQEAITSAKPVDEILFEKLSDFVAKAPKTDERSGNSAKLGVAAAFAWVENTNSVTAEVAPNAHVTTPGALNILAAAEESISFETSAAVDERDLEKKAEGDNKTSEDKKKIAVSASVLVLDMHHHADARIGDGAVIGAGGPVNVNASTAIVPFYQQWPELIAKFKTMDWDSATAWYDLGQALYGALGDPIGASTWSQTAVESEKLALAGALEFLTLDNKATAKIGDASINAGTDPVTASQDVTVSASASQGTLSLVGVPEWDPTSPPGSNTSTGTAGFGGSYLQFDLSGGSEAVIAKGADLRADDVAVLADTAFDLISVTETVGKAGKVSINGAFSLIDTDVHTIAQIGAAGSLAADDVLVRAADDSLIINVAGGVARSQSVGIGFSVAINDLDREVRALIGNRTTETGVGGSLTASGNLLLDAEADGTLGAFTVAGSGPAGGDDSKAKGGDGKKTNVKDKGEQGKSGVGISGAASVNEIIDTTAAELKDLAKVTVSGPGASAVEVDKDADGTADETVNLARGLDVRARNASLAIAGAGSLTVASGKSGGLAGAFTWNELVKDTRATITGLYDDPLNPDDGKVTVVGGGVNVDAENTGAMWSISAGAAGASKIGVAGSVAYSNVDNVTDAAIENANVDADGAVTLDADDGSDIRGVAGAVGYGGKAGVGAAVAINTVDSDTSARVVGAGKTVNGDAGVAASATNDNGIFAVAAAIGASQGVADSGAVTANWISNRTEAAMTGATVTAAGQTASFDADDTSSILSISGNAAVSTGQASVGISASYNDIGNETYAKAVGGSISAGTVRLEATEAADIQAIAAGGAGAAKVALTGSLAINTIGNITEAASTGTGITSTGDTTVRAADASGILSITGAIGIAGNAAVGASGSYNHIGSSVTAQVSGGTLSVANLLVDAERAANLEVWAVAGSGAGTAGFAGSIALNDIGGITTARIGEGAQVDATGNALVTAQADDEIESRAGAVAVGGSVGGAGSIAFNDMHADTLAEITGASTRVDALGNGAAAQVDNGLLTAIDPSKLPSAQPVSGRQLKDDLSGVAVVASSTAQVENFAISGGGGGSAGVAGTVSVAMMTGYTTAEVSAQASVNSAFGGAAQEARVAAYHHDNFASGSGGAAVGGSAGLGGALDTLIESHVTTAQVKNATVQAQGAVKLDAGSTSEIAQAVIGLGIGGYAGLAGSFGVVLVDNTTQAVADDADLNSKGDLTVEATSSVVTDVAGGAVAASGAAGIGLTGTAAVYDQKTRAWVKNGSKLNAIGTTLIHADSRTTHHTYAATAAAAGGVGIAGTANVVVVKGSTEAAVGTGVHVNNNEDYDNDFQDVTVAAADTTTVDNKIGGLGVGLGGVGVGAAADVVLIHNGVTARVDSGADLDAGRDIRVAADSTRDTNAVVVAAAGGLTAGISGAVSVVSVGARPDADAKGEVDGSLGEVSRRASANAFGNQLNSDAGGISESRDRANTARAGLDLGADLNADLSNTSAAAAVAGDLDAGRHVTVAAHNRTDTDAVAVGAAVSGGLSLGGGVALSFVDDKTRASLTGTTVAGGNVSVTALDDQPDLSRLRTYAGGAGLVGLGASVAIQEKYSSATAELGGNVTATSGTVTVDAGIDHQLESEGGAGAVGVAGVGAAIAYVTESGEATARVLAGAQIISDGVEVHGHSVTDSHAVTIAAAGGIVAGAGADANVLDEATANAELNGNADVTNNDDGTGSVRVHAEATPRARAETLGVSLSLSASVGAALSDVLVNARSNASVGTGVTVKADTLTVEASLLKSADTAWASAEGASGGLLIGINATKADARNTSEADAHVGADATLEVGATTVRATMASRQTASASGLSLGIAAVGANKATASSETRVEAWLADGVQVSGESLTIGASGDDDNFAAAVAGAGGVVAGLASEAATDGISHTSAHIGAGSAARPIAVGDFQLSASQTARFNAQVDSTAASLVGASGATARNSVESHVSAEIGDDAYLLADSLEVEAHGESLKPWLSADAYPWLPGVPQWNVRSGSGGLFDKPAASSESTIGNDTRIRVGERAFIKQTGDEAAPGEFRMDAWNEVVARDKVKVDSGGAIAVPGGESLIKADSNVAAVEIEDGAKLSSLGDMTFGTRSIADVYAQVAVDTYGIAGAPEGASLARFLGENSITIGDADLISLHDIYLNAGQDTAGFKNSLSSTARTDLWNNTLIPLGGQPAADAIVASHNLIDVGEGADVQAVRHIYLLTEKGNASASGVGIGKDIYRETLAAIANFFSGLFGGDPVSFETRAGTSQVNQSSEVVVDGKVGVGIQRKQELEIGINGTVTKQVGSISVGKSERRNVAQTLLDRIATLRDLIRQYSVDDQTSDAAVAVAAYESEIRFLERKLDDLGYQRGGDSGFNGVPAMSERDAAVAAKTGMEQSITEYDGSRTTLGGANTRLGNDNTRLAGVNTTLAEDIASLRDAQSKLNKDSQTYQQDYDALQTRIDGKQASIDQNLGTIAANKLTIKDNTTEISRLDNLILGLQDDIGDIQKDLDNNTLSTVQHQGPWATFLPVGDAVAQLGNIYVQADRLSGKGILDAPGDAEIKITNQGPSYLILHDLTIPADDGGKIYFNNIEVADNAKINAINGATGGAAFAAVTTGANDDAPAIKVINEYNPLDPADLARTPAGVPPLAPDILLTGALTNLRGLVSVTSEAGGIRMDENASIRAGSVAIALSNGDFVQSYSNAFFHAAGAPLATVPGTTTPSFTPDRIEHDEETAGEGIVANGSVLIAARYLNINGIIQSGKPEWGVQIPSDAGVKIGTGSGGFAEARADWLAKSPAQQAVAGAEYYEVTGASVTGLEGNTQGAWAKIKVQYNAKLDRLELEGVQVEGGYIELFGQIFNTNRNNGGRLRVLDGYGQIKVDNQSAKDLVVNLLDAGRGVQGKISITNILGQDADGNLVVAEPVILTRGAGEDRSDSYSPRTGLRYAVSVGYDTVREDYYRFSQNGWFGITGAPELDQYRINSIQRSNDPLSQGEFLTTQGGTEHYAGGTAELQTSKKKIQGNSWKDCNWWTLCANATYYMEYSTVTGTKTVTTESVRADYPIAIDYIGFDQASVNVNSVGNVLINAPVNNRSGDTRITSSAGNILQTGDTALVSGRNIDFSAATGIGSGTQAIQINLGGGVLNAVSGAGEIHVEEVLGDLVVGRVGGADVGKVRLVAERNLLAADADAYVQGKRMALTARNGGIGDLAGGEPLTVRTAYSADASLWPDYGLEASARDSINLRNGSDPSHDVLYTGDLLLISVVSQTGDVRIETEGSVIDNNPFARTDERTEEELAHLWDSMRLRGEHAQEKADEAVASFESGITQDYRTYWLMRQRQADSAAYDPDFRFTLSTVERQRFLDSGMKAAEVDAYEKAKTTQYHQLQTRLYGDGADAVKGPVAAGYDAQFVYVAETGEADAIRRGASWTDVQLELSLGAGLLKEITDTVGVIKEPNAKGRSVTLIAGKAIGSQDAPLDIDFSVGLDNLTQAQKAALAAAERGDASKVGDTTIRVLQPRPVNVEVDVANLGSLYASAGDGKAYLGSEQDLRIERVEATGEIRIKTAGALLGIEAPAAGAHVSGANVILESATGSIGDAGQAFLIGQPEGATLVARAAEDIHIGKADGDLYVDTVLDIGLDKPVADSPAGTGRLAAQAGRGIHIRGDHHPYTIAYAVAGAEARFTGGLADITIDGLVRAPLGIGFSTGGLLTLGTHALVVSDGLPVQLDGARLDLVGGAQVDVGAGDITLAATRGEIRIVGGQDPVRLLGHTVSLLARDDIRFAGAALNVTGALALRAGTDGSGSILGDAGEGPDALASGSMSLLAPDAVGAGTMLELAAGGPVDLRAGRVNAAVAPEHPDGLVVVGVSGPDGGMATKVNMELGAASRVWVTRLLADQAVVRAWTSNYNVARTQVGDYAEHHVPGFAIRFDHQDRAFHPGFDARAFTLDGGYALQVENNRASIGAYVIQANPDKIISSDPGGSAAGDSGDALLGSDRSIRDGVVPFRMPAGLAGAPAAGLLVDVADWMADEWFLDGLGGQEEERKREGGD